MTPGDKLRVRADALRAEAAILEALAPVYDAAARVCQAFADALNSPEMQSAVKAMQRREGANK